MALERVVIKKGAFRVSLPVTILRNTTNANDWIFLIQDSTILASSSSSSLTRPSPLLSVVVSPSLCCQDFCHGVDR
eukprot:scaffold127024_cov15-Prasinocladus_malaysianus.AAC.2